jgi:hypothetical protein
MFQPSSERAMLECVVMHVVKIPLIYRGIVLCLPQYCCIRRGISELWPRTTNICQPTQVQNLPQKSVA